MNRLLTPARLRQGFALFVLISLIAYGAVLLYGHDTRGFIASLSRLRWRWVLVGAALASMDWIGGGLRLWVLVRVVHPKPPISGMIVAGGMGAWGSYVTPFQAGASPLMIYAMRRVGVPVPKAMTTTLMSFIATVAFFAIAGPLALVFGAGKSLAEHGHFLGLNLLDLFKTSMAIFVVLGILLLMVMLAPRLISAGVHRMATALGKRSQRVAARLDHLRMGIDQAHESMRIFNSRRGWLALFWATILSGPSHANKLLAGYVALRAIGIHAQFVDILLLQTFISSMLYFAPTPGASGFAEGLSTIVMTTYVAPVLIPVYTLVWRFVLTWFTIAAGFVVFTAWVRRGLQGIEVPDP
ncbi:MAG: lysylphosphatidylglycerol synthase transmembrane domain-containing protein [Gemmatimonadales bacterium]